MSGIAGHSRIKITDNFYLDEFVPPELYWEFGAKSMYWIRPELFQIAQAVRDYFGITYINTWWEGGNRKESGLRLPNSTTGAELSLHKFGGAIDPKCERATADDVRQYVAGNYYKIFKPLGLTRMEARTKTWVHLDIANTGSNELIIFNP